MILLKFKHLLSSLFLLLLLTTISGQIPSTVQPQNTIILMHPTIRNIQTLLFLADNNIFPVPDDFHIIGVYHTDAEYNYVRTDSFLVNNAIQNIIMYRITCSLAPENIYQWNSCSQEFHNLFYKSAGIMFFGGPDIPPSCYGHETNLLTQITDPSRHFLELSMMFHLIGGFQDIHFIPLMSQRPDYAILGICLGMQTMNVAAGGTLIQDIPSVIYNTTTSEQILRSDRNLQHRNYHHHTNISNDMVRGNFHKISFAKESLPDLLNKFSVTFPHVWSTHHQCIDKTGKGITPIAHSVDRKIIEAVIHEDFPNVIGIQFHPEVISIFQDTIKLRLFPEQEILQSFQEMFPAENGSDFHYNFWKYTSEMFFRN
jgi:putative glutamine amidotransferase